MVGDPANSDATDRDYYALASDTTGAFCTHCDHSLELSSLTS
jgi:hypothetical protein